MVDTAAEFSGSMPEHYDSILGPAQFEAFAADLVRRLPVRPRGDVLELACGTGILTQRLRERIDGNFRLVATDANDAEMQFPRLPYSYNDQATIRSDLDAVRFGDVRIERVKMDIKAPSARAYATGQVRGTPRGALIEKRGVKLDEAIDKIAAALAELGGSEPFKCEGHALVVHAKAI